VEPFFQAGFKLGNPAELGYPEENIVAVVHRSGNQMDNLILLGVCFLAGTILRHFRLVPDTTHLGLNAFIINISLPALTLNLIHQIHPNPPLAAAALMPWFVFCAGAAIFALAGKIFQLPKSTTGALIIAGSLGNTAFIGLPMIEAFYGKANVPTGIVIDQLGTYLALNTIGLLVICICVGEHLAPREILRRIATFPPMIALLLAICLRPLPYPLWATTLLTHLGDTLTPLALVSVGLQLRPEAYRNNRALLAAGLGFKLLAAPMLVALLYFGALRMRGPVAQVTVFEAGMAPQIGGAIVAIQYGLDANLITLMVGIGTILSFITAPILWHFFH
jgi:malate permease and related proteins